MKKILFCLLLGSLTLAGCGLYKPYESQTAVPDNVYGEMKVEGEGSMAAISWRQMFSDPQLQTLIEQALTQNADAKTARLRIEQAEISYRTSKLAYLPTVAFSPTANVVKQGTNDMTWSYSLGMAATWQLDVFGASVTNTKRKAKAASQYAKDLEQATQCQLVSSVAQLYYQLLSLDRQLAIEKAMTVLYEQTYETVQTLFEAGTYTSPAVLQTKANLENLRANIKTIENSIENIEHSICLLIDEPMHKIPRGTIDNIQMPTTVSIGLPSELLKYRPDVRAAERNIEMAYYDVLLKKGALYPSITLTANGGWTDGSSIINLNPAMWFIQGIGSLVQPIFMGGKLRADLKATKIDQQIALINFRKTVIDAGHEVTTAMSACKLAQDKTPHIQSQEQALAEAVAATQELMNNGTTSYLEVITALQNLLNAQLAGVENKTNGALALVKLYAALGGGGTPL